MTDPATWRDHAACKGQPLELFFPECDGRTAAALAAFRGDLQQGKETCGRCLVRAACLRSAPAYGTWGGFSESERRAMSRAAWRTARRVRQAS